MITNPNVDRPAHEPLILRTTVVGFVTVVTRRQAPHDTSSTWEEAQNIYDRVFESTGAIGDVHRVESMPDEIMWQLSNGNTFRSDSGICYRVNLSFDRVAVVFSARIINPLEIDEAMEICALLRDAKHGETINPSCPSSVIVTLADGATATLNEWLRQTLDVSDSRKFPYLYVERFEPWCDTAEELVKNYGAELAALAGSWILRSSYLKANYISELLAEDFNPLIYGVTFFTPRCTVEFHPKSTLTIIEKEGYTPEQHHREEWIFLTALLILLAFQRSALELDDKAITAVIGAYSSSNFVRRFSGLRKLSKVRARVLERLNLYWNIQLARREYMSLILQGARKRFLIDNLYESVRVKLTDAQEDIKSGYDAVLSMGVLILTILALILALAQLLEAFVKDSPIQLNGL